MVLLDASISLPVPPPDESTRAKPLSLREGMTSQLLTQIKLHDRRLGALARKRWSASQTGRSGKVPGAHTIVNRQAGPDYKGGAAGQPRADPSRPKTFGSQYDQCTRKFMKASLKLGSPPVRTHANERAWLYAKATANHLIAMGLTPINFKHTICDPVVIGFRTQGDLICFDGSGNIVVVELKTTQFEAAAYAKHYHTPDRRQPYTRNHFLLNSEYNHHQMQLGLMLWALTHPDLYALPRQRVSGFVLTVAMSDRQRQRLVCTKYDAAPWVYDDRVYRIGKHPLIPPELETLSHSGHGMVWRGSRGGIPVLVARHPDAVNGKKFSPGPNIARSVLAPYAARLGLTKRPWFAVLAMPIYSNKYTFMWSAPAH